MGLSVQVLLTFPCSPDEWERVCKIRALVDGPMQRLVPSDNGRNMVAEALTDTEKSLLDQSSKVTHEEGHTPLMDALETSSRGRKVNGTSIRSLMMSFLIANGGAASREDVFTYVANARQDMRNDQVKMGLSVASRTSGVLKAGGMWSLPAA